MNKLIDPTLPANRIVGSAMCPACALEGHDGDSCRANLGNDRRVSCVMCGRVSNQVPDQAREVFGLPPVVRSAIAALIGSRNVDEEAFRVVSTSSGSGHGAVAQGFGPEDIKVTVNLTAGQYAFQKVELSFTGRDLRFAENASRELGRDYDCDALGNVPDTIDGAARRLIEAGFRLTGANLDGALKSLTLVKGARIPRTSQAVAGVRAQLTWIVS